MHQPNPAAATGLATPPASPDWHSLPLIDQDREAAKLLLAMACDPEVAPRGSIRQNVCMHAVAAIGVRLQRLAVAEELERMSRAAA